TAAAIWRGDDQQHKAEVVALSSRMPSVSSVLFLAADGSVVVGEAAERRALTDPDRVVREFKRRIGDDTPLLVGGQPHAAQDLAAMMVRWVVDRVTERQGGSPDRIAITHPAGWGPYKKNLLSCALGAVGLTDLTLMAEPEAAAVSYAVQERVEADSTIAVYDLGGGTFDAAVVRKTGSGSFTLLGSADGLEQLGGADFDEAVFTHVQGVLSTQQNSARWDALDTEDPNVLSGLARLRRECIEAKEALSSDTEVSIPVLLPGVSAHVRLVRSEFEDMIRPALEDTVDSLSRAIDSAGLDSADLGSVLLVGGSSRVPLVSQLVSARLGCPVVVDADPKTTIALGAALSMAPQTQPSPIVTMSAADPALPTAAEQLPDQAPARPSIIPAQREAIEDDEPTEDDASLRRWMVTGRLRNIIGVGVLAGVLLVSLGVAAAGGSLPGFTDGSAEDAPVSADPPSSAAAVSGHGGTAKASNAGSSNSALGRKATTVTHTITSTPGTAPVANPPASAGQGAQDGRVTPPVPPASSNSPSGAGSGSGSGTGSDTGAGAGAGTGTNSGPGAGSGTGSNTSSGSGTSPGTGTDSGSGTNPGPDTGTGAGTGTGTDSGSDPGTGTTPGGTGTSTDSGSGTGSGAGTGTDAGSGTSPDPGTGAGSGTPSAEGPPAQAVPAQSEPSAAA
ncbi:MAG TPA: Hsp70 family protein, partial [Pseudonocardiaceae bacterium]|nr:Hsp70 family protein [Pseudonocardiaceae bacterium]